MSCDYHVTGNAAGNECTLTFCKGGEDRRVTVQETRTRLANGVFGGFRIGGCAIRARHNKY